MITYIFVGLGGLSLILFLLFRDKKSSVIAVSLKTLTSLFFIATAFAASYSRTTTGNENMITICLLTFTGLLFGLVGDFMLDFKIYFKSLRYEDHMKDSDKTTYVGMIAFACGHILYIAATLLYETGKLMYLLYSSVTAILFAVVFIFIIGKKVTKLDFGKFLIPSLIYCFLLSNFVFLSLIYLVTAPNIINTLRFTGALLFLISDLVLSMTYFSEPEAYKTPGILNPESRFMISINHITYYAAQFILAILLMYL